MKTTISFSVLMSVYNNEKSEYLDISLRSIWLDQILRPNEIILVKDGPLNSNLNKVIDKWKEIIGINFKVISLNKNVGLGKALQLGLRECEHEIVARMDTDDIAKSDRFKKQIEVFKKNKIDVCSSWVTEFEDSENNIISVRSIPETHDEISKYFKKRNGLNHPAVMYRKSKVNAAGGYKEMLWFEDYYLWIRMLQINAKFYNIQESLVNMRSGLNQLKRRSGFRYAYREFVFQLNIYKIGFINILEMGRNIFFRSFIRILPHGIIKYVYKLLRN